MMNRIASISIALVCAASLFAQRMTREQYVDTYKQAAIDEMHRNNIPASITLAQGILESDCGNSDLARKGNNHFGIKCHDWTGDTIHHDDDRDQECFRKYAKVEESYADHSKFLKSYKRYASLFELEHTDYKGWAYGLKKAGYATDTNYAENLIRIIEELNLHQYDLDERKTEEVIEPQVVESDKTQKVELEPVVRRRTDNDFKINPFNEHAVFYNNGVKYVEVLAGDTFKKIADEFYLRESELLKYNDLQPNATISGIKYLYIRAKRSKAHPDCETHVVKNGETAWQIAHMYGIKLKKLRRMNNLSEREEPLVGVKLSLRKRKK